MAEFVVSTHSRLKAAGKIAFQDGMSDGSFNTQPPEGGWLSQIKQAISADDVSTHSRLKAAGQK